MTVSSRGGASRDQTCLDLLFCKKLYFSIRHRFSSINQIWKQIFSRVEEICFFVRAYL